MAHPRPGSGTMRGMVGTVPFARLSAAKMQKLMAKDAAWVSRAGGANRSGRKAIEAQKSNVGRPTGGRPVLPEYQ